MRPGRFAVPAALVIALVVLDRTGGGPMDIPLGSVAELSGWVRVTAPIPMAMALLRLAAFVLCGYLLVATVLPVVAQAIGCRWLAVLATRALPVALRRTLTGGAGLGLAAGSVLWSPGTPAGATERPALEVPAETEPSAATMTLLDPGPGASTATMRLLDPIAPAAPPGPSTPSTPSTPSQATTPTAPAPTTTPATPDSAGDETWVVATGDSFWSIAEDVVGDDRAAAAEEAEIDAYWHQLVAANRDRLAVPDQPDLLFPGQVLTLPRR